MELILIFVTVFPPSCLQQMKSVINLVQTSQGYSIIEGNVQVNRATSKNPKEKNSSSKKYFQQNYTIYPYILADNQPHKYLLLPARSLWFNLNSVHQIEKKALPEWFRIKKGILATMSNIKLEKHEELYKKYRNYIVELGKKQYVSPSQARKGLAGDACAIVRIHNFLEKWGLINYIHPKPGSKVESPSKSHPQQRKDCFDKDKLLTLRSYSKDDLQLLKKITRKFRPLCHFCQGICGILWFQYTDQLTLRQIIEQPDKKGQQVQSSDQKQQYSLILCSSCFHEGNYPLVLTHSDFTRKSVLQKVGEIQNSEGDKKKGLQQNRVAQSIEKNRFRIVKTAEQLKMNVENVFRILMTMPLIKLQKISRIEPETEPETEQNPQKKIKDKKQQIVSSAQKEKDDNLQEIVRREVEGLEEEYRETYQRFIQGWILKMVAKLERLKEWEEGVFSHSRGALQLQKNLMASRVRSLACKMNSD